MGLHGAGIGAGGNGPGFRHSLDLSDICGPVTTSKIIYGPSLPPPLSPIGCTY